MVLTQEYLKELLHYNSDTGIFIRKVSRAGNAQAGMVAGSIATQGYVIIGITVNGVSKLYKAHRLAFLYMEDHIPKNCDHINRVRDDNRWANLRPATHGENNRNQSKRVDNISNYTGVSWNKARRKWRAYITHKCKQYHIGLFDCKHAAARAYNTKAKELHGEFAVLNIIPEDIE